MGPIFAEWADNSNDVNNNGSAMVESFGRFLKKQKRVVRFWLQNRTPIGD